MKNMDKKSSNRDRRGEDRSPRMVFKDSVNPDDYQYLSNDQWNEQSRSATRLSDVLRKLASLMEKMF